MIQCLYRHFDKEGTLLYIGISLRALNRLGQHRDHSKWFNSITRVEMEHFPTREEACEAERIAITDENPKHNIQRAKPRTRRVIETRAKPPPSNPEMSRHELLRRIVRFHLIYTMEQVGDQLGISTNAVRLAIEGKTLGHTRIPNSQTKLGYSVRVSGWQLIDYIEYLQHFEVGSNGPP